VANPIIEHKEVSNGRHSFLLAPPQPPELAVVERQQLPVWISEPPDGVNSETFPLLALHGFGRLGDSDYLKSFHESIRTKCNALVITLDYLGTKILRDLNGIPFFDEVCLKMTNERLVELGLPLIPADVLQSPKAAHLTVNYLKKLREQYHLEAGEYMGVIGKRFPDDHYDFGLMQTIDCLWAIRLAKEKFPKANWNQLTAAGISHGGYLSTQCARFAPNTFSLIINSYGWVKPYLKWIHKGDWAATVQNESIKMHLIMENYWSRDPNSQNYFSPDRAMIRTQLDTNQIQQWKAQTRGPGPHFVMTQQIDDEMHPRSEKEVFVRLMKENGFDLEYLTSNVGLPIGYQSLDQHDETSFKGLILDFADPQRRQNHLVQQDDFERGEKISYQCGSSLYEIDYSTDFPSLGVRAVKCQVSSDLL